MYKSMYIEETMLACKYKVAAIFKPQAPVPEKPIKLSPD